MSQTNNNPQPRVALLSQTIGVTIDPLVATLAREIAQDIFTVEDILRMHGLSLDHPTWMRIQQSDEFNRLYEQFVREWNAADSTPKRIRAKAMVVVEDVLPKLHSNILDGGTSGVEAMKMVAKLAGLDAPPAQTPGDGAGFSLTINIAGDKQVKVETARTVINGFAEARESEISE